MLRSGDDDLLFLPIPDGQEPCPATLADHCPGHPVEAAVGHTLLDAGFTDHMHLLAEIELLYE